MLILTKETVDLIISASIGSNILVKTENQSPSSSFKIYHHASFSQEPDLLA